MKTLPVKLKNVKLRKAGVTNSEETGHVVNNSYKPMEQAWVQKWQSPLPISSWLRLEQTF